MERSKHFVFVMGNDVFVGVNDNAYTLTKIPPQSFRSLNHHSDKTPRWGGNDYIYLDYIPVAPRYEGRLLNHLASLTIVQSSNFYILAPTIAELAKSSFKCTKILSPPFVHKYHSL
jgi:hypothetical protein